MGSNLLEVTTTVIWHFACVLLLAQSAQGIEDISLTQRICIHFFKPISQVNVPIGIHYILVSQIVRDVLEDSTHCIPLLTLNYYKLVPVLQV